VAFVITEGCVDVKDKTCLDNCPVDCIYEGERMVYIHPDQCIDCGACEPLCPQEAIYYERDLPAELGHYSVINAEFFSDVSEPDNALDVDYTDRDHPRVASMARG
jgi:NAD-dependent dihydropyrimidine dehydrogenase PreA subunit